MSNKNIVKKNFFYNINFKNYKLTVRKKTVLIWDILENTGQNTSRINFVGTTENTKLITRQSRIIWDVWT